jgi:glycosyltransferase involved in cell wall biosynthesis
LVRLLRQIDSDVLPLHVGGDVTPRVLSLAYACTLFGRGRKVLTVHSGGWPETEAARSATQASLTGMILRKFDRLIAVNEPIADVFRRYGVPDERISVILPFALKPPAPDVEVPDNIASFYRTHSPVLLAVGGLEPDYDPLLQIRALGEVLKTKPRTGLIIAGDGSMRNEVEAALAASGYADHIMLAGSLPHDVVLHLICDVDILLRTTLFDGDAISVREALFLGTPVVATDNGHRPQGVHLIPTGDANALAGAISKVAAGPSTRPPNTPADVSNIRKVVDLYKDLTDRGT